MTRTPTALATTMALLVLLAPTAGALTIVTVNTTNASSVSYQLPFSDTYSWSLASTIFDQPIFRAYVAATYDFGEVKANQVVHVESAFDVEGEDITAKSYGEKSWTGASRFQTEIEACTFAAGCNVAWVEKPVTAGVFGSTFSYQQTHMLKYAENVTAIVPANDNGNAVWDWDSVSAASTGSQYPHGRRHAVVDGVKGLFWVRAEDANVAQRADNSSGDVESGQVRHLWLVNMTAPDAWTMATSYQDRSPATLDLTHQFHEQASFFTAASVEEPCDGISRIFLRITGACPTLTSMSAWAISFVPTIIGKLLGFINPTLGGSIEKLGEWAGEFVAIQVFMLQLLLMRPGDVFLIVAASASGAANLVGGMRGDLYTIFDLHAKIFSGLAIGLFWYFYMYWKLATYAIETIMKIVDTIGNYIPFT